MKTLADIRRRATEGARLEVLEQTRRPALVGTVRTILGACSSSCYDWTSSHTGDERYCTRWPKARDTRILDADTFEYDLPHPAKGHVIRMRFMSQQPTPDLGTHADLPDPVHHGDIFSRIEASQEGES